MLRPLCRKARGLVDVQRAALVSLRHHVHLWQSGGRGGRAGVGAGDVAELELGGSGCCHAGQGLACNPRQQPHEARRQPCRRGRQPRAIPTTAAPAPTHEPPSPQKAHVRAGRRLPRAPPPRAGKHGDTTDATARPGPGPGTASWRRRPGSAPRQCRLSGEHARRSAVGGARTTVGPQGSAAHRSVPGDGVQARRPALPREQAAGNFVGPRPSSRPLQKQPSTLHVWVALCLEKQVPDACGLVHPKEGVRNCEHEAEASAVAPPRLAPPIPEQPWRSTSWGLSQGMGAASFTEHAARGALPLMGLPFPPPPTHKHPNRQSAVAAHRNWTVHPSLLHR